MSTAIAFPGISHTPFDDVGRFLLVDRHARELTAVADEVLGCSLVDRFREAEGAFTDYERVAFLVACLALAERAAERPVACVGPSFGGTPAAVYSGALSLPDAVRLTAQWSRYLAEYFATEHGDVVTQSFARLGPDALAETLAELADWHDLACRVDDDVVLVSVRARALDTLTAAARARGALPLYTMRPPMHCAAFRPLRDRIERDLVGPIPFVDPVVPIVSDHDGAVLTTAEQVRTLLLDGIVRRVEWPTALATLTNLGVRVLYVSGPDALWGRVPCARNAFEVIPFTPAQAMLPRPAAGARRVGARRAGLLPRR